ncbi:MAG: bacterial transcriptional activator domain-containing protein [Humibacillus sp.]|nr:bacterial transcriptional activator domain-containing protein [Humibacillus sp.]
MDSDPLSGSRVVATVTGLGALAAAGLLLALRRRRGEQTRRRRPGRRIALPKGPAAIAEAQLRAAADPIAIEDLDRALRTLAGRAHTLGQPMPSIRAARLAAEEIELYLVDDLELPRPFVRVKGADATWTLARQDIDTAMLTTEEAAGIPAPCPTMVTVGHDQDDAHVLVNLEEIGSLGVTGDEQLAREVLTGLTLELIVSPWADTVDVALVGVMSDYACVQPDLCHYVEDVDQLLLSLEHDAGVNDLALHEAGVGGPTQARSAQVVEGVWVPRLVVIGVPLTEQQSARMTQIVQHVPRLAVAALTSATTPLGEWTLSVQPGHPHPAGALGVGADPVPVRPQHLSAKDYRAVVAAFAATYEADEPGPEWAASIIDEPIDISAVTPVTDFDTADAVDDSIRAEMAPVDPLVVDTTSPGVFDEELVEDPVTATDGETANSSASTLTVTPVSQMDKTRPVVRLLGPIEVIDPPGPKPGSPAKCRELIAYLALHPGHGHEALDAAIYPGERVLANRRNGLMRQARAWLGTFEDGRPRLPHATGGIYKLDEENTVDSWRFQQLVGDDLAATPTPNLKAALELVEGQPMTYPEADRYAFADTAKLEILDAVADVAYELARRAIASGDPTTAEWAAGKGLDAQPTSEALWRVSITAAYQTGRPGRAQEVITRCHQQLDPDESDLDPETQDLINQVTDRHIPAHA